MMPTISRLPSDQFKARGYKTTNTPFFLLKIKENSAGKLRLGMVVGKSVDKTAAKRNFWKRQVKAGLSPFAKRENDILIILSPNISRLTKKAFQEALAKTLAKI
jgi:ribonuclease P protein component